MFPELTGTSSAAECEMTANTDERTADFLLTGDDPDIVLTDLRSISSK